MPDICWSEKLICSAACFRIRQRSGSCVTIINSRPLRRAFVSDHISRKELKHDKIKETIEHGAEAVISHGQFTLIVVFVALVAALGYGGLRVYVDRPTGGAAAPLDPALKAYQGRLSTAPPPPQPTK